MVPVPGVFMPSLLLEPSGEVLGGMGPLYQPFRLLLEL
jgi:hypothetical protein